MKTNASLLLLAAILILPQEAMADEATIGSNGIRSAGLLLPDSSALDGADVPIGQVEPGRPGKHGLDADIAINTLPAFVYVRTSNAASGANVDDHAQRVAGIMISSDSAYAGVAPSADLYASAYNPSGIYAQREAALSANHIATRNGGDMPVINFSFGEYLEGFDILNGGSHLTQFVDWSAKQHDVLYVVAFSEIVAPAGPVPTDNFNGITVAIAQRDDVGSDAVYRVASPINDFDQDAVGSRTSIDLIAPGEHVGTIGLNDVVNDDGLGTSYAAPHVAGAVALLQQYARYQQSHAGWSEDSRRHEVMKAI